MPNRVFQTWTYFAHKPLASRFKSPETSRYIEKNKTSVEMEMAVLRISLGLLFGKSAMIIAPTKGKRSRAGRLEYCIIYTPSIVGKVRSQDYIVYGFRRGKLANDNTPFVRFRYITIEIRGRC